MTQRYAFTPLSEREQREHEQVLLVEIDVQRWFAIAWCRVMEDEVILSTQ